MVESYIRFESYFIVDTDSGCDKVIAMDSSEDVLGLEVNMHSLKRTHMDFILILCFYITKTFPCRLGNFRKLILYNNLNILFLLVGKLNIFFSFFLINVK